MSIWKEIKHALNSTLGTSKFMPLDELYKSTKLFVTEGGVILKLSNGTIISGGNNAITSKNFVPEIDGTLRLYVSDVLCVQDYASRIQLFVYENDEIIAQTEEKYVSPSSGNSMSCSLDFSVKAGQVYKFGIKAGTISIEHKGSDIRGSVKDYGFFEYN